MWRRAASGLIFITIFLLAGVSAFALDVKDLPEWVRDAIEPVEIDWSQLYPGLVPVRTGLDLAGASPTGAKAGDELSAVSPAGLELERVSLGQASKRFKPPEPARADAGGMTLLARLRPLLEKGEVDRESFPQWSAAQKITDEVLIQSLNSIPLSHPMDTIYLPISAALWERMGDDIDRYLQFPYTARITMAIYMGVLGREEDAKKVLASIETQDKMALGMDLYHVANELVGARRMSPLLAVWAWKRGAELRGPADEAFVCHHIAKTCRIMGGATMVREEVIPWAEQALAHVGSETRWQYALRELIWAHHYIGDRETAIARGRHWLEQAGQRGIPAEALTRAASLLALMYVESGQPDEAVAILPARFRGPPPGAVTLSARPGQDTVGSITLDGNQTFRVTRAECTIPSVQVAIDPLERAAEGDACVSLRLSAEPAHAVTDQHGALVIETNDATNPRLEVPVRLQGVAAVTCRPNSLFFGFLAPGGTKTARAVLTSTIPLNIIEAKPDRPALVRVNVVRTGDDSHLLEATLEAPNEPGALRGSIEMSTDSEAQPTVLIPYHAHVLAAE